MTPVSPTRGRRAAGREDKRRRLRDAAWELFSKKGFERTTTKEIARRAGIASGTLFLYARDKPDLLFLVLHDRLAELVDKGLQSVPRDARLVDQLAHVFSGFFRFYAEAPELARRFVKELPGADGPNAQRVNGLTLSLVQHVAALVQSAQARGEVAADVPPLLVAQIAFSLYYMALLTWLGGFATLEGALDPLLRSSLELVFRGIAARDGLASRV